jgi:hypothetical protein
MSHVIDLPEMLPLKTLSPLVSLQASRGLKRALRARRFFQHVLDRFSSVGRVLARFLH